MDINNTEQSSIMINWLASLFTDPHKKGGYIICEIERRLPAPGCSLGITPADANAPTSVLNRSTLPFDKLTGIFESTGEGMAEYGDGMAVSRLEVPSTQGGSFHLFLYGQENAVAANMALLQVVAVRAAQKFAEEEKTEESESIEGEEQPHAAD